jgi:hypothetical protein
VQKSEKVLSVPCGKSQDLILQHLVYACPDGEPGAEGSVELITFRPPPYGEMGRVFPLEGIVVAYPADLEEGAGVPEPVRGQLLRYLGPARRRRLFEGDGCYRFYLLKLQGSMVLSHKPRPDQDYPGPIYFLLEDLLRGDTVVGPVGSWQSREPKTSR